MNAADWVLRSLRATRAKPPSRAADSPQRRALYSAGLEQFEQLLRASEVVRPAARPLPLFYALSQAGRAIVASRGDEPEVGGHGLSEDRHEPAPADPLHRRVKRSPAKNGSDVFGAVCRATGSPDLMGGVELGAVWTALPGTYRIPDESWLSEWRTALGILDETAYKAKEGKATVQVMSIGGNPHHDEMSTLRGRYPSLPPETAVQLKPGSKDLGPGNWIAVLTWNAEHNLDDVAATDASDDKSRFLIPTLPGHTEPLSALMMWWVLLFGLSIFARYHPGLWVDALDVDRSALAVPLEGVLDAALTVVPAFIHRELLA